MTDYYGIALAGFATGLGVIIAQKFIGWLEKHPIVNRVSKRFNSISRGEESLADLADEQRRLARKIEARLRKR
jgi:hypothetical protein